MYQRRVRSTAPVERPKGARSGAHPTDFWLQGRRVRIKMRTNVANNAPIEPASGARFGAHPTDFSLQLWPTSPVQYGLSCIKRTSVRLKQQAPSCKPLFMRLTAALGVSPI